MKRVKLFLISNAIISGVTALSGVADFFLQNQTAMPVLAVVSVSAFVIFLTSAILWEVIDIIEHLAELATLDRVLNLYLE